jgi:RHS repeat-associated protein
MDYFEARYLRASAGRFTTVDPVMAVKDNLLEPQRWNRYANAKNNPLAFIDPDGRDAIAVVFPDYKIQTPLGKFGNLGHAGVVTIDSSGRAKYFEYGRYDEAGKGLVREVRLDPVVMGSDGKPSAESLNGLMKVVSREAGHGGKIEGAYFATDDKQTAAMNQYAEGRQGQNGDPTRESYDLQSNNCATFMDKTLEAGGAKLPPNLGARPNGQITPLQSAAGNKVEYDPAKGQVTVTPLKKKEEHP